MARKQIYWPVIVPLLLSGLLLQTLVPLARIATSYRAIEAGLPVVYIGLLSTAFALLPVFLTIALGRYNDRSRHAMASVAGAVAILAGCLWLWLTPLGLANLFIGTTVLGLGQTLCLSTLQLVAASSSSRYHRDSVIGNYMMSLSLGQALGPLLVALPGDIGIDRLGLTLLMYATIGAAGLCITAPLLAWLAARRYQKVTDMPVPLTRLAATKGLWWIIMAGSIAGSAQDLLLIFMPVLGIERGIAPSLIGAMLSLRAVSSMVARMLFHRIVRGFGRNRTMLATLVVAGVSLVALVVPMPGWAIGLSMLISGFAFGLALTCSVTITLRLAPSAARATVLSLRLTSNRIAQFTLPLVAGIVAAPLGAGGVLGISGVALLVAAATRPSAIGVSRRS